MGPVVVEAEVRDGKIVPLRRINIPEGQRVVVTINTQEIHETADALRKLKGVLIKGQHRDDWYAQADLY